MLGRVICLALGLALILGAVLGRKFHSGLSASARIEVPSWQGRSWLIVSGFLIVLASLGGLVGDSFEPARRFAQHIFVVSDVLYELFGGIMFGLVGTMFLFANKERVDLTARLLGAAGVLISLILVSDALLKMKK